MPTKNNWKIILANSVICRHENNNAYLGSGRLLLVRGEGGIYRGDHFQNIYWFWGSFSDKGSLPGGRSMQEVQSSNERQLELN